MASLTFVEKLPSEPLCSRLPMYLKSVYHHYSLTLTITSCHVTTDPTKAAMPSCEQMAEMNHSELAMWQANAQLAATQRKITG